MTVEVPPCVCCLESKRTNTSHLYFVTVVAVDTIAVDFGGKKKKKTTATSLILPLHRKAPITLGKCSASQANPTVVFLYGVFFFWLLRVVYLQKEQSTALIPNGERCGRWENPFRGLFNLYYYHYCCCYLFSFSFL